MVATTASRMVGRFCKIVVTLAEFASTSFRHVCLLVSIVILVLWLRICCHNVLLLILVVTVLLLVRWSGSTLVRIAYLLRVHMLGRSWRSPTVLTCLLILRTHLKIARSNQVILEMHGWSLRFMTIFTFISHYFLLALLLHDYCDSRCNKQLSGSNSVCDCTAKGLEPDATTAVWGLEKAQDCQEINNLLLILLHSHSVIISRFCNESIYFFNLVLF